MKIRKGRLFGRPFYAGCVETLASENRGNCQLGHEERVIMCFRLTTAVLTIERDRDLLFANEINSLS